jgi:hypothetical protein
MCSPTWTEAKAMGSLERKAYLYVRAMAKGGVVDWTTGRVKYPER